jgi:hypothetical protein
MIKDLPEDILLGWYNKTWFACCTHPSDKTVVIKVSSKRLDEAMQGLHDKIEQMYRSLGKEKHKAPLDGMTADGMVFNKWPLGIEQ